MTPTLQKLYDGELRPDLRTPETTEYVDSHILFNSNFDALKNLVPEFEPKLTTIMEHHTAMCAAERKDMFQYGFSLGVRLVLEALSAQ